MPALNLSFGFSTSAVASRIEKRYGLAGFARLIKLLEILASSDTASGGIVPLPRSDWRDALRCTDEELYDFLGALMRCSWLTFSEGDEPGAPLVVVFCHADDYLPTAEPLLFTTPEQWVFWCETELNMSREVTGDPLTLGLFRRWCASNVTVTEMHQACEEAAPHHSELTPGVLHAQLQAVRRVRLEKARA